MGKTALYDVTKTGQVSAALIVVSAFDSKRSSFDSETNTHTQGGKKKKKHFKVKLGKAEEFPTSPFCLAVHRELLNPIKLKLFQEGMLNIMITSRGVLITAAWSNYKINCFTLPLIALWSACVSTEGS